MPSAQDAQHIAVLADSGKQQTIALVETKDCRLSEARNLAGDAANVVTFERVKALRSAPAPRGLDRTALLLMGSTIRSVETAGALEAVLSLCVAYANERVAFERRIGKFQAVQQNLARLAGEVAAALAVSGSAADTIAQADSFDEAVFLEAASAKIRTGEAATEGAAIAHQVFGAIGFTQEHVLHRFTLRMLSWRDDFGNESYWAAELGSMSPAAAPTNSGRWWRRDDARICNSIRSACRPNATTLRAEVRAFLAEEIAAGTFDPHQAGTATPTIAASAGGSAPRAGSA